MKKLKRNKGTWEELKELENQIYWSLKEIEGSSLIEIKEV